MASPPPITAPAVTLHHGDALDVLRTMPVAVRPAPPAPPAPPALDPILDAIKAAEPHRPTLLALWRQHEDAWTDVHTAAVKARLG